MACRTSPAVMPSQKEMEGCVTLIASLTLNVIKPKTSVLLQTIDQSPAFDLCTERSCKDMLICQLRTLLTSDGCLTRSFNLSSSPLLDDITSEEVSFPFSKPGHRGEKK